MTMAAAFTNLPARMTTIEVCELGRFSVVTLFRKRRADPAWLPASTVQGGRSTVFDREAVLKALNLTTDESPSDEWTFNPDAYRAARSRPVRDRQATQGRNGKGAVRGAGKAAPLRLAASNPAPVHR